MCGAKVDVAWSVDEILNRQANDRGSCAIVYESVAISRLGVVMTSRPRNVRQISPNVPRLPSTKSCQTSSRPMGEGKRSAALASYLLRPMPFIDRGRVEQVPSCRYVDQTPLWERTFAARLSR